MAKRTSLVLTKDHLDGAVSSVNENIKHLARTQAQGFSQIDNRFTKIDSRFTKVDDRLDQMDTKLDAIMEMLAMRKEMQNLIRPLKLQGIVLDETKIFVS